MAISPELRRIYASAPNDDYYIETLQLNHPGFADDVGSSFITNQLGGVDAGVGFYNYVPFTIIPPKAGESGTINMQVVIDNVSKELMSRLEAISGSPTTPIQIVYRIYLSSNTAEPANDPPLTLEVTSVVATENAVSFTAGMTNLRARPFPSVLYDKRLFPGLDR